MKENCWLNLGRPNLIIGNYSDGNLVAFLLARRLKQSSATLPTLERPNTYLATFTGKT